MALLVIRERRNADTMMITVDVGMQEEVGHTFWIGAAKKLMMSSMKLNLVQLFN